MGPEAILLIIMSDESKSIAGIEFKDLKSCQIAEQRIKKELEQRWMSSNIVICLPNGSNLTVEKPNGSNKR